jgi:hypothetical protein
VMSPNVSSPKSMWCDIYHPSISAAASTKRHPTGSTTGNFAVCTTSAPAYGRRLRTGDQTVKWMAGGMRRGIAAIIFSIAGCVALATIARAQPTPFQVYINDCDTKRTAEPVRSSRQSQSVR